MQEHRSKGSDSAHLKLSVTASFLTERAGDANTSVSSFVEGQQGLEFDFEWCQRILESREESGVEAFVLDLFGLAKEGRGYFAILQKQGGIERIRGAEAWDCFFAPGHDNRKFIFLTKDRFRTVGDQSLAHQLASQTTDCFIIMALKTQLKRVRQIPWSRETAQQTSHMHAASSSVLPKSTHFQHDLRSYRYAGQLQKSSFSPYLPYASVLSQRLPHSTTSAASDSQLISLAISLMKKRSATVSALTLLVGDDGHERRYLLAVANVAWSDRKTMTLPALKPLKTMVAEHSENRATDRPANRRSLGKSLSDIIAKELKKPPFVDTNEIQTQNIRMYERLVSSNPLKLASLLPEPKGCPGTDSLTLIAEKFDQQKQQLDAYKTQSLTKSGFKSERFREIVEKAYRKCAKDEVLERFFGENEDRHIQHLSEQFQQALTTPKNYYLSRRIRKVHQHFGITADVFQRFLKAFREAARESGVSDSEEETMLSNILWYQSDIVTSSHV